MIKIRKPIITVLGHVDSGKTTFLDKVRGTTIAEEEAGRITQHIGATEVPIEVVKKIAGEIIEKYGFKLEIPGLLFIDTPGHEAFTNLRKRGGSIADLAVLIIDINAGIQKQTAEAIDILKTFKTPFIIALTKIDALLEWNSVPGTITNGLKNQTEEALEKLDKKIYSIVGKLHEKGFVGERFDRIKDFTKEIAMIPVSNKTGEGIPEVLMFLAGLSQKYLENRLELHEDIPAKGTVLEIKEEKGLGKTIDVILYDGIIRVGEEIVLGGKNGLIKTKVRALLEPKPLDEIRAPQERFSNVKEVNAAAGVKIAAPNLGEAIAGSPLRVLKIGDEDKEIMQEIQNIKIESDAIGPILKTDALGSLEALVKLLEEKGFKIKKADLGDVTRKDVMEIESVKEKDASKGVIFAFNVKILPEAEAEAKQKEVKIFQNNVVYKLIEDFEEWVKAEKEAEKKITLEKIVFPVKVKILPNCIFRNSKPAIVGVRVLEGRLRCGIQLMNEGKKIGTVECIQDKGENLKEALKDAEVAISIEKATVGRNIKEKDELFSFIPLKQLKKLSELNGLLSKEELKLIEEIKKMMKTEEEEEE